MDKIITCLTGPSLSGKTTNSELLLKEHDILMPKHTTTREARADDKPNFYRHISLNEFLTLLESDNFLVGSTDGIRGYGVLHSDCCESFKTTDTILLNVSYKDIEQLKKIELPVRLVVLTYKYLEVSMKERMLLSNRVQTDEDIAYRLWSAKEDHNKYFEEVSKFAKDVIYTDEKNKAETYDSVCKAFGFSENVRKRVK